MIQNLNAYEVISTSESKKTVIAADIKAAVNALVDTLDPIVSARLIARNQSVEIPDANEIGRASCRERV